MPYKRRYRRRAPRRGRFRRRRARRAYVPRPEMKHVEISLAGTFNSIGNNAVAWELTNLATGASAQNRIGNRVSFSSISFKGIYQGYDVHNVMRLAILKVNDSWATTDFTIDAWDSLIEGKNVIKVLFDRYIGSNQTWNGTSGISPNQFVGAYRKLRGFQRYDVTTAAPAVYGRYVMVAVSDSAAVPHPGFINGYARATYIDA